MASSSSTTPTTNLPPKQLRPVSRFITAHNAEGKAIFSDQLTPHIPVQVSKDRPIDFWLMYTTSSQPAQLADDKDISDYAGYLDEPPSLTIPNGSVGRICDFPPRYTSAMHRTVSLDLGIVVEGEIELVLDSGETRRMKVGDVAVQRGTNHAWRNVTPDEVIEGKTVQKWARMFYVLQAAEPIEVAGGVKLDEDLGGISRR